MTLIDILRAGVGELRRYKDHLYSADHLFEAESWFPIFRIYDAEHVLACLIVSVRMLVVGLVAVDGRRLVGVLDVYIDSHIDEFSLQRPHRRLEMKIEKAIVFAKISINEVPGYFR